MPPPASAGFSAGASTPECAVAWAGRGPHVVPTSLTWRNPHQALLAPAPASCDSPPAAAPGPARPAQPSAGEHGAAPARGRAGCPVLGAQPRAPHRPPVPALLFLAGRRPLPSGKVSPARCWGWGGGEVSPGSVRGAVRGGHGAARSGCQRLRPPQGTGSRGRNVGAGLRAGRSGVPRAGRVWSRGAAERGPGIRAGKGCGRAERLLPSPSAFG